MGHVFRLTEPEHICQKIPGKDTGAGVDVNGSVGKTVQQELLVDDVLAWIEFWSNQTVMLGKKGEENVKKSCCNQQKQQLRRHPRTYIICVLSAAPSNIPQLATEVD